MMATTTNAVSERERYPDHAVRCDGCGAICVRAMVSRLRSADASTPDGMTDVASYFEPTPRYAPIAGLSTPGRLTWCCECHRAGSYCLPGDHDARKPGERDDPSGLIRVRPGERAPRCLFEAGAYGRWNGRTCALSARGVPHHAMQCRKEG